MIKTFELYLIVLFLKKILNIFLIFFALVFILNLFEEISFFKDLKVGTFFPVMLSGLSVLATKVEMKFYITMMTLLC